MGFWKESQSEEADSPKLKGRLIDISEAEKLMKQEHWKSALDIIERVLALPSEYDAAEEYLRKMLEDKLPIHISQRSFVEKEDHNEAVWRFEAGGGLIPHLIALRGQCLMQHMSLVGERLGDAKSAYANPEFLSLVEKAFTHAKLTLALFSDHAGAMVQAGILLHFLSYFEAAVQVLTRVLELDPNNERARNILPLSEQRLRETRGAE